MPNDECLIKGKLSAVFLDRDGVVNEKPGEFYVTKWEEFKFLPGVIEAIKLLNDKKIPVYIISNQSGIGRGFMTMKDLDDIHDKMQEELKKNVAHIDDIFVCPHAPDANCDCRKPKPGLLLQAKKKHPEIDLKRSWFVGDSERDVAAGKGAGCNSYLLKDGQEIRKVIEGIIYL